MVNSVGIVGFGAFGKLLTGLLLPHVQVFVCDKNRALGSEVPAGATFTDVSEVAKCSVVVIATDLKGLESVCIELAGFITPQTTVMDICSVKARPSEILVRILGGRCRLLATHPLFGPQSVAANGGTQGLKMMWHELEGGPFPELEEIWRQLLGVELLRMTPEEHDKEMAWVHGLTFFVGRALLNTQPPESKLATHYYNELMDLVHLERSQSMELFMTIQQGNPFAEDVRNLFIKNLEELEQLIKEE